jgi:ComF family protein
MNRTGSWPTWARAGPLPRFDPPLIPGGRGVLARALKTVRDGLLSLAYPEDCHICGNEIASFDDGVACADCWQDARVTELFIGRPSCARCGMPGPGAVGSGGWHCGLCDGLPFSSARACGAYSGALRASILFLKSHPHVPSRLRAIILEAYEAGRAALGGEVVMPVPLARRRERERGFNQAALVAKVISSASRLPLDDGSLARVKHTRRHRAGMDRLDRARSVERAFEVTRPRSVEGSAVVLVDDLYTTGSTLRAAAEALLGAGAARVSVFTVARVTADQK